MNNIYSSLPNVNMWFDWSPTKFSIVANTIIKSLQYLVECWPLIVHGKKIKHCRSFLWQGPFIRGVSLWANQWKRGSNKDKIPGELRIFSMDKKSVKHWPFPGTSRWEKNSLHIKDTRKMTQDDRGNVVSFGKDFKRENTLSGKFEFNLHWFF